jgi:hypothetical protein
LQAGFFAQLAAGAGLQIFTRFEYTAGQPPAFEISAVLEQNPVAVVAQDDGCKSQEDAPCADPGAQALNI